MRIMLKASLLLVSVCTLLAEVDTKVHIAEQVMLYRNGTGRKHTLHQNFVDGMFDCFMVPSHNDAFEQFSVEMNRQAEIMVMQVH